MAERLSIFWFRQDLRLDDNAALRAAAEGGPLIPVYIWAPESEGAWPPGAAGGWWLHHSLRKLAGALEERGSRLVIASGDPADVLPALAADSGAQAVFWNHRYEPDAAATEDRVASALRKRGVEVGAFHGSLLFGPDDVRTSQGGPFRVFTPFWRACLALPSPLEPAPPPKIAPPKAWPGSLRVDDLALLARVDWASGIRDAWTPGEDGARAALDLFIDRHVSSYVELRDQPGTQGTSRLSPHLHFGEIGPRRIWHETRAHMNRGPSRIDVRGAEGYLRQLGWREFAHHLMIHFPETNEAPLRPEFSDFPWRENPTALESWRRGRTGFPFVDAGMRELWATGWMHNRVRMVAASFLVKDLLIHWLEGARWFWDTLVDADLPNNTLGWQWTAGCGADAAPFFRVFNPVMQGEKFDPRGSYVRRWIPEIAKLPDRWIHKPWEAPPGVLGNAGIRLGDTYALPIVDHFVARDRALAAFSGLKKKS